MKVAIDEMVKKFEIYWPKIKEFSILCHSLDPRFKLLYIKGREPKRLAKKILLDCFERYLDENIETEEIPITPSLTRPKSLAERMIATITNTSINNESEIDKYLKQPAIIFTEDIDILKWWDNNRKNFLILSRMAMDYLGIMPSSIPSERCFSIANLTIDKNRSNLAPDTVQELLCLKSWNKLQ